MLYKIFEYIHGVIIITLIDIFIFCLPTVSIRRTSVFGSVPLQENQFGSLPLIKYA